jgi:hypothetical protein
MRGVPANALQVGRLARATIPEPSGQIPVQARIVGQGRERWMPGTAKAWTSDAVGFCWTDTQNAANRIINEVTTQARDALQPGNIG